jgi:hypothetical protein
MMYVPDNQMPEPGYVGWTTIKKDANNNPIVATWWINTNVDYGSNYQDLKVTIEREMLRSYGFVSCPVPSSWWNEGGTWSYNLNTDDGYAAAIAATLKNGINIAAYPDSVVSSIDLPPSHPLNVSPADGDTLSGSANVFAWSGKPGSKPVTYTFTLFGNGKSITKTTSDTSIVLDSATVFSLVALSKYGWTVSASDGFYATVPGDTSYVYTSTLTAVKENGNNIPSDYALYQNYPEPFNPTTIIEYDIPKPSYVTLTVYDILGRKVETLVSAEKSPGHYETSFDGAGLPSGVYFYRLQAGSFTEAKKLVLLK